MKTILQKHILLTNSSAVKLRVSEGPALLLLTFKAITEKLLLSVTFG